ncbi:hypothetical protein B5F55_08480 [Anaerotruncus colihominis]|uniref:zinc-ribbon domain-containing protein n=1 Tax=Anaerotruncus colihominis TaxID=169435 RepID=UPI000B3A9349|nr:zinc-ribbon domain-containing protein [Anaerotruncus colihominis]OUO67517.1 hypothetical protein B5F55_08480 [Anaerotruncus colihominis]
MVCKKCGRNVKGDFKFCPYCGERLVSDFHDHYSELDPPFLVQEPDGPDTASDFYTYAPDEQEPDFGAFDDYDTYEQEMPHGRAADDDSYFVYQPQEPPPGLIFHTPDPDDLKEERPARSGRRFAEKRAPGLVFKLFLILLILALAAGVTIFGYYLLRSPAPFESFDLAATFAVFPPF